MTNEQFAAALAGYSATVQKDTLQEKIDKLNERTAEKVDRLNPSKAVIENYTDTDYTGTQSKHGKNVNTTGVHDFTNQQEEFGRLVSEEQVYTGKFLNEGTSLNLDPNSNYKIKDGQYVKFEGPTRNAYMKNMGIDPVTGEQIQKFGLARNDLTDEAIAQGITPERARYMNKMGVKVYKGSGGDYDGTPGERGKAAGEAIFDATFDEKAITEFELNRYMDKSTIAARAMGLGKDTDYAAFGAGGSEYTIDRLDPLFNANAPKFEGSLPAGTQTPTVPKGFDKIGNPTGTADRRAALDKLIKEQKANGGGVINAAKAFAYTLGEGVVNTLDLIPETAQFVYGNIVGDKKWSDSKGLYDTKESEAFKTWVGYNDEVVNAVGKETVTAAKNAWEKGDYWELLGAMGKAAVTPELLATSLGYVAGMVLPGGLATKALQMTSKVGKTANAIKAADATGKMTKGEALLQAEEAAGDGYKILKTMTDNVGFASEAEQFGRDAEKLYMDTYKTEMPTDQKMLVRPLGLLYAKMDALTAKAILMGKDPIAKAIPDMVNILPEAIQATMAGKVATMAGTTAAKAAGAFGLEGATEAVQTAMEKVAGEYKAGEVGVADVLEKEKYEIAGAGLLGGVGGNQMQVAGKIPSAVMDAPATIKKGVELATETPEQKTIRQNVEYSRPLKNKAMFAALSGNAVEVADRAEKVHGKLSTELDESAPKSHTYSKILKDSLEVAQKAGDEEAINNVYKTIAELDKDENVEFKATDLVKESGYEATKKLIELINQNVDTTDSKMQELKGRVTKDIQSNTAMEQRNAEIVALRDKVLAEKKRWSIMGTDEMDPILDPLTKVETAANEYLEGKKTLDDVNKEFAELGFMDTEGKADPSRPGLATYEKELTDQLLNTKTNKNLLKVAKGTNAVRLKGLTGFAQSRLNKLQAVGTKDSYQTGELIGKLKAENEKMLNTITNVLKTAKGLKNIDADTKKAYEAELKTAAEAAIESSKELDRRNAVLDTVTRPEGVAGALAFQVDADGESIQAVTYKDGKPVKTKIADVVDGKVVPVEKYAEIKEPKVEIAEPADSKIATKKIFDVKARVLTKPEMIETIIDGKVETTKQGQVGDYVLTGPKGEEYTIDAKKVKDRYTAITNPDGTTTLKTKPVDIKYSIANKDFTFTASWGEKMIAEVGDALVYENGKLGYRIEKEIFKDTYATKEEAVEPVKTEVAKPAQVDLSGLTEKQQEFMAKYKAGKIKHTAGLTRRYNELMEKAKQPKVEKVPGVKPAKKESRARQIKAAAEIRIGEGEDEAAARVKAMFQPEDEVKAYSESLSDEDIAEQTMAMEENQKTQEQLDEEEFQKFSDSVDEIANRPEDTEETAPVEPEGPLATVRESIAKVDAGLSELIAGVEDMDVKRHVKEHYTKKLGEIQADKTRLGKMIDRLESVLAKRMDRKYDEKSGNIITALVSQIDSLVKSMILQLSRLEKMLKKSSKEYKAVTTELNSIIAEIDAIESGRTSEPVKKTIGTVVKIDEKLYGKPVVDVDGKRVAAERQLTKKGTLEAPATAINRALETLKNEKMDEIRVELKDMEKGKTSLGAKLLGRLLINFPMNNPIHKILKRGEDSVFGQLTGNTFAKTDRLLEVLPKGFKDFFITDAESKQALLDNFATMAEYVKNTKIGDIVIGKNRIAKNIDQNGLIMLNVEKDGKTYNFPVDVIELLGTEVDGKLQLDEQTQNILKFYSAKMLVDTQKMVGLILSLDESEMGQVLGIYDAEEQLKVKQEAMEGYINSASIRKDIGDEVYQALGLKFNELAPEFTVESFKSAIGILVQAIAIENGSMERKKGEAGGKNQNLIKTNWDTLTVERDALTKAIAKLQYLNENRSRPLPGLKKPADDNNRGVMNTQNPMDEKSSTFLNKQEKIAYKISPRLARWLAMDEAEVLKAMGYMDVKNAGLHVSEIDAQMARNDKLVREWEILKTFAKATGNKKFYLKWGQTVSGRFTILNDLNYQESKLHREFVVAEGSTESVDVNDKDARQMLEASILQGLDMDPDKLSPETASEKFNEVFKVTDKGIEVAVEGPIKTAYEAMRDGKVDADALAIVFDKSEGHHGISSIELLVAWDEAIKSGKKLETHANLEIDAITSGMILTLLQIGSNKALEMAEKGGIYTAKRLPDLKKYVEKWLPGVTFTPGALIEAGKKHAAEIEGKMKTAKGPELVKLRKQLEDDAVFKDLYSTIGVAMIGEVQAYKETLLGLAKPSQAQLQQLLMLQQIGDLNLKNIRSIAKSPVMVYIYGATVSSIKKKLTYSLGVDTLVKALKNASKLLKDGKDASAEMNFINGFIPENEWKFVNEFGAKIEKPAEMWEQLLAVDINGVIDDISKVINATFGKAIEVAFDSRLGFVNKNRDAAKAIEMLVFQTYQVRLTDKVQKFLDVKYGVGRHKGESYKLSKDDMQNINQKLADQGYGHNIVWYEDGKTINQSLNKTDTKGGIHSSKVTVGKTSVGGQIKQFKPTVNTGAAPTISVHAIDGRMMLDVLNREIDGKYTGGNIYDAVVLSVNKAMLTDTADSYNTNMIETGFSRSVIADQLKMLENMFYIKDEAGNKQFDELTFNKVLASIGLRPEGELRDDYTKEANRIGLGIGKMLERLERAEMINGERLANSGKEFHSGHLYQMGSGVVKVDAANTRAKQFPVIDTIKRLLTDKLLADRKITHAEFDKAGVKLHKDTDYVVNLDDAVKGSTQIASKANIVQIKTVEDEMTATDKLWGSLGANDTVQIIASKSSREWLESEDAKGSPKYWADKMLTEVLKSDAKIVANGFDVKLEESGRVKVDGVWVKESNEGKADTQEEVSKIDPVEYVQDKIAPWIELDKVTKQELAKITDKNALDKIAEDINCKKG